MAPQVERHTVRTRWLAVGALSYGRLHLQLRFPHPQRVLEDVLAGPAAHPARSRRSPVAAVGTFRPVGETGVLRDHPRVCHGHRGRCRPVLARGRRRLYRNRARLQCFPYRAARRGRGFDPLRRHLPPRRRSAYLGPLAIRSRVAVRPGLLLAGLRLLRRRVVDSVRCRVGVVGPLANGRGLLLFPANETYLPRRPRRETVTRRQPRPSSRPFAELTRPAEQTLMPVARLAEGAVLQRAAPSRNTFTSSLKVSARSSCGRRPESLKRRGSERGLCCTKRCASRTGAVRASRPQQIRVLCGTRGQRSATLRLSLPETKAAGKYLAPGWWLVRW